MKTISRWTAMALCLALLCAFLPQMSMTAHAASGGTCGENLTWTLDEVSGVLTIEGSGAMDNYESDLAPWYDMRDFITAVEISEGMTSIGARAFIHCSGITKVTIPDSVTVIGRFAFQDCDCLAAVTIPANVECIEDQAFSGCASLTEINVASENPNYSSRDGVLFNKSQSELLQYPGGKTGFYEIPNGVSAIADCAFRSACLTGVSFPETLTEISWMAFGECKNLTEVQFSDSIEKIETYAFCACTALPRLAFPENLKTIGMGSFSGCSSLSEIVFPDNLRQISDYAFSGCPMLTTLRLPKNLKVVEMAAFLNCTGLRSIFLPEGTEVICNDAFDGCTALIGVYIPSSVTKIAVHAFNRKTMTKTLVIYGEKDSAAQAYAKEAGFRFVPVDCFVDVKEDDACHDSVLWALVNGVTAGRDATHFAPNETVTRSEAMLFLYAAKGRPAYSTEKSPFKDVKKKHWYYDAVMWAVENKISDGTDATHFSPKNTCSRSEILQFLYAAENKPGYSIENPYADVKGKHWYHDSAIWANENGLEQGENGRFNAKTPCTRAYAVSYLYRFFSGNDLIA